MTRLSFVTVVYESEYPLATLQARSMARYMPADLIDEIILIDNSYLPMPVHWATEILNEYGQLRSRVRVVRAAEVCAIPLTKGWYKQQVLKLTAAFLVQGEFYVALDAKNHFVWPADRQFFVTTDGRPCVNAFSYVKHPLRQKFERVMRYLGLDPADHVDRFAATVTPYTFKTQWVRDLVLDVGQGSKSRFAREFVEHRLTEFFLYAGWLVRTGRELSQTFHFHQRFCRAIWPSVCSERHTQDQLAGAHKTEAPIFSVHRGALKDMPIESRALVASFWVSRDLFASEGEAQAFIERFRDNHDRQSKMIILRSLPYEISRRVRSITRLLGR